MFTALIYKFIFFAQPYSAYKFTLWITNVLGGIYMYRIANWLLKSIPAALLTGAIYLTAPYMLIVNNHLFGFNEGVALGILPVVLFYTFQRYQCFKSYKSLLKMSIAWYLLITIHLITFVYTSITVAGLFILMTAKNAHHRKNLAAVGASYLLACLLALWFLAPILLQAKYFIVNTTFNDKNFDANNAPLLGLLSFTANYLFEFIPHLKAQIIPAVGWLILLGVGLSSYILLTKHKFNSLRATYWQPYLLLVFFISFLFTWAPLNIWQYIPTSFKLGQYSYRLLSQTSWSGALITGYAICWMSKKNLTARNVIIATLLIFAAASSWIPTIDKRKVLIPVDFIQHPKLISNQSSFLIDTSKNPQLIDSIDNVILSSLIKNNKLVLNKKYFINKSLLEQTVAPDILLQGNIAANSPHPSIQAFTNGKLLSVLTLKPGKFSWHIPLNLLTPSDQALEFKLLSVTQLNETEAPFIFLDNIVLSGFNKTTEIIDFDVMRNNCSSIYNMTHCKINVAKNINTIVLPIHYYPGMLHITLNGKTVSYKSILRYGYALTAINPDAGKVNLISIQFTGLTWANRISGFTWLCCILLMIYLIIKKVNPWVRRTQSIL